MKYTPQILVFWISTLSFDTTYLLQLRTLLSLDHIPLTLKLEEA